MKKKILTLLFCCICTVNFAQDIKRSESYNYTRGVEAVQNDKTEEALEYLNKEVQDNPENGYDLYVVKNDNHKNIFYVV